MVILHTHHIIPKYMGGTDDPSNLIKVTPEEHARLHLELYEKYGNYQDWLAYQGLSKQMSQDEILAEIYSKNGKNMVRKRKENGWGSAWNKGKKGMYSEETLKKMSKPKSESHKINLRKSKSNTDKMKQPKSESHRQALADANKGKKWYTNHQQQISRQFNENCQPDSSWILGRKYYKDGELAKYTGANQFTAK